jgi:hypothetical protein
MSTTKHITRFSASQALLRAGMDPYQSGIDTDTWRMAHSNATPDYIYLSALSQKIAVSDGSVTYLNEAFQDVTAFGDLTAHGVVYVNANIEHISDTSTKIVFGTGIIDLWASGADVVQINGTYGSVSIGSGAGGDSPFAILHSDALTDTSQTGIIIGNSFNSAASNTISGMHIEVQTASGLSAVTNYYGQHINDVYKNGTTAITNSIGILIDDILTGATTNFAIKTGAGVVYLGASLGLGALAPSAYLDIEKTGTLEAVTDFIELTNLQNSGCADIGTGTGILFNHYYTGSSAIAAGRISLVKETSWVATASTQNAYMSFQTVAAGSLAERVRISSAGNVVLTNDIYKTAWNNFGVTLSAASGTVPTYSNSGFYYHQVGKIVFFNIYMQNTSGGTAGSGGAPIRIALPVAMSADYANITYLASSGFSQNYTTFNPLIAAISDAMADPTHITMKSIDGGTKTSVTCELQDNGARGIWLSGWYEAA